MASNSVIARVGIQDLSPVPPFPSQDRLCIEEVDVCQESLHRILLGGDQLTAVRARTRVNSLTCATHLGRLIPCARDWHKKVSLLDVS